MHWWCSKVALRVFSASMDEFSLGKTLESALWLGIEIETLSRMYVQALRLGEPPVLPDDKMTRVIEEMRRMSYG